MALSVLVVAFDVALALALIGVAVAMFMARDHLASIALFITFGTVMAVTWTRLGAPDIALAEAAIGAGITGALLLRTLGHVRTSQEGGAERPPLTRGRVLEWLRAALVTVPLGALLLYVVLELPLGPRGLADEAFGDLEAAGMQNPVTAVLLSYRGFDTLLELAVLVIAVVGAWAALVPRDTEPPPPERLLVTALRVFLPASVLVGGYLLWRGTEAPGGAFQAGAVLAAAGVLLSMAEPLPRREGRNVLARWLVVVGVLLFSSLGAAAFFFELPALYYRGEFAKQLLTVVEVAATVSIGAALLGVFVGQSPERWGTQ